jgi:formate-dependent nitrite reductase membrane component NrfD
VTKAQARFLAWTLGLSASAIVCGGLMWREHGTAALVGGGFLGAVAFVLVSAVVDLTVDEWRWRGTKR